MRRRTNVPTATAVARLAALLALCVLCCSASSANYSSSTTKTCALRGSRPEEPVGRLEMCRRYQEEACCIPQQDAEIKEIFLGNNNLGAGCYIRATQITAFGQYYCLGCSPRQPDYTNEAMGTVRICKEFADELWSNGRGENNRFDNCGLMKPTDCTDTAPGDPFDCGDDLVIPRIAYDNVTQFMNNFKPPLLEDYTFVVYEPENEKDEKRCFSAGMQTVPGTAVFLSVAATVLYVFGH